MVTFLSCYRTPTTATTSTSTSTTSTTSTSTTFTSTSTTISGGPTIGFTANSPQTSSPTAYSFPSFTSTSPTNVVLVVAVWGSSAGISGSKYAITDTAGLTWNNKIPPNSALAEFDVYYAVASSGVSSDVVKVTPQSGSSSAYIAILTEVDGALGTWDPAIAGNNIATNPAPSVTTSNSINIMLAFTFNPAGGTSTASYSNGYALAMADTQGAASVGNYAGVAYKDVTSSGSQSLTITYSGNTNSASQGYLIGLD